MTATATATAEKTAVETLTESSTAESSIAESPNTESQGRLAPPFGKDWDIFGCRVPNGFWGTCRFDRSRSTGSLQLGASPSVPNPPTTIGWYWLGAKKRVSVSFPTLFIAFVRADDIVFRGGGTFVPRAFITLTKLGGQRIEKSVVLTEGRTVPLVVGSSGPGTYDLTVEINARAVYSGAQRPYGEIRATFRSVDAVPAFSATDTPDTKALHGDLDPEELARALEAREEGALIHSVDSDREALTAGPVTLGE